MTKIWLRWERRKNPIPIIMTLIYIHAFEQIHLEKMPLHRKIFPWPKVGIRDRHRNDPKQRGEKKCACFRSLLISHSVAHTEWLTMAERRKKKRKSVKKRNKQEKNNNQRKEMKWIEKTEAYTQSHIIHLLAQPQVQTLKQIATILPDKLPRRNASNINRFLRK